MRHHRAHIVKRIVEVEAQGWMLLDIAGRTSFTEAQHLERLQVVGILRIEVHVLTKDLAESVAHCHDFAPCLLNDTDIILATHVRVNYLVRNASCIHRLRFPGPQHRLAYRHGIGSSG